MEPLRRILPAGAADRPESSQEASSGAVGVNETGRRRRKVLEKPALIACLECRRTRVKCNGKPPETCDRCRMRAYTCEYPPHTKLQKDDILLELAQARSWSQGLEQRNRDLSTMLDIVARQGSHQEIMTKLQAGEDVGSIIAWLSGHSDVQIRPPRPKGLDESIENAINNILHTHGIDPSIPAEQRPRWTNVTSNTAFLDHLVGLYLQNTEADFLLFRAETFMQSYIHGESEVCSSTLLNAICSMACKFLNTELLAPEDRANVTFIQSAFMKEAQSLISLADSQNMAAIQAMAVMHLADLSNAHARVATTWLKIAAENLKSLEAETEMTADFDLARWTIHSLDTLWSAYSFQNPCSPQTFHSTIVFDSSSSIQSFQNQDSGHYMHHGKSLNTSVTAIHAAAFRARLCQLSRHVFRMYCGMNGLIEPETITSIQGKLLALLEAAPTCLKDANSIQTDPCLQSLHILYYGVAVSLWSPLVSFAEMQQNKDMLRNFQDLLLESSRKAFQHIEDRLKNSREKDFLPQNLIYIVNICDSIARWTSNKKERYHVLHCCLSLLSRNTSSQTLCRVLMKLFLSETVKFVEEKMINELQALFEISAVCSIEEALDATTRLTYITPFPAMVDWLSPNFTSQWSSLVLQQSAATNVGRTMRIRDICN